MKTAVVDVGGGMRGVYASGVLDRCLKENIQFDLCIGVSAGSANLASYLSGQMGRNLFFYHDYAFRKEYMSLHNFFHTHSYVDLEYIYATLSNQDGENALNYSSLLHHPAQFWVVAEEAVSGKPRYFTKEDIRQDDYRIFMASSCLPGVNRPFLLDGVLYYDGALADPVPIQKAFDLGCDRVVLLLTKPSDIPPFLPQRPADCPHDRTGISRLCPSAAHPRRALQRLCCPRQTVSAGGSTADCRTL